MAIPLYITNNDGAHAEFDAAATENGSSTCIQTASAALGGLYGIRATLVGSDVTYYEKSTGYTIPVSTSLYVGAYIRPLVAPSGNAMLMAGISPAFSCYLYMSSSRELYWRHKDDSADLKPDTPVATSALAVGRWYHIIWRIDRAASGGSDGGGVLYINGTKIAATEVSNIDNDTVMGAAMGLRFGCPGGIFDGLKYDTDLITVTSVYPYALERLDGGGFGVGAVNCPGVPAGFGSMGAVRHNRIPITI